MTYLENLKDSLGLYILNDAGEPERCDDLLKWAEWFENSNRCICQDMDEGAGAARVRVSTVFLGVNHRFFGDGPPILWETMVFGGPYDKLQRRYTSRDEAFKGHQLICQQVSAASVKP